MRKFRKQEHLEKYLRSSHKSESLFDCVFVDHQALSPMDFDYVDTSTEFLGRNISMPFMINAVTGGTDYVNGINRDLGRIAKELNIPMAVGSQKIAVDEKDTVDSFKIIRESNPDGIIIGNLSATCDIDQVREAIDMIDADGFQLHLNIGQELIMPEGDKDFTGIVENIQEVVKESPVPIIVKEVGMGISKSAAEELYDIGVRYIDVAGKGGTNFVEIENLRDDSINFNEFYDWGIPTALSLLDVTSLEKEDLFIISGGGVVTATEVLKSLVMGADLTAGSGEIIRYLSHGGYDMALKYVEDLKAKLKVAMMMAGGETVSDLKSVGYRLTGQLKDLTE